MSDFRDFSTKPGPDDLEVELESVELTSFDEDDESVTARTMRLVRAEWEAPLRRKIADLQDAGQTVIMAMAAFGAGNGTPEAMHEAVDHFYEIRDRNV